MTTARERARIARRKAAGLLPQGNARADPPEAASDRDSPAGASSSSSSPSPPAPSPAPAARTHSRSSATAVRHEAADTVRRVLDALAAGELTAPAATVHRLEGAALALDERP